MWSVLERSKLDQPSLFWYNAIVNERKKMIYTSFIYLLIAIALYSGASAKNTMLMPLSGDLILILFLYLFFMYVVRMQLRWIRVSQKDSLGANIDARQQRNKLFARFRLLSIIFYAFSIYFFDLKALFSLLPGVVHLAVLQNLLGVGAFIFYWCILWYWEFREGDAPQEMESASQFIREQISVQFGVFIPWLVLSFFLDLLLLLPLPGLEGWVGSPVFQLIFYALFFLLLVILSPLIMIYFWRCHPLDDDDLRSDIENLCKAHGVRFRGVLSWDALGGGLITAGVIGLFPRYRYLLITPRLRQLLSRDEMLAVTAHEIAHVKRRHLLHYFAFILGFILISMGSIQRLLLLFFNTRWGQALIVNPQGELRSDLIGFIYVALSLSLLILYFRFVFGYFMRHFERQADLYPLSAGMNPGPLLSAFEKLARITGDDGTEKNWHHFTLPKRMATVEAAALNHGEITAHNRSVRRSLSIFWTIMILLAIFLFSPFFKGGDQAPDLRLYAQILEKQLQADPHNTQALLGLAGVYYEMKRWHDAEMAYLDLIKQDASMATALNNLAWLYLTCEDEAFLKPDRALPLAEAAVKLDYGSTTLDTLAEAYYQNKRYEEAYRCAREAFRLAEKDEDNHFARQLQKMEKAWKENRLLEEAKRNNMTL